MRKMEDERPMIIFYLNEDDGEPKRICSFHASNFNEWLQTLIFCQQNEVDLWFRDDDEQISKEIIEKINFGCMVEDVSLRIGSDDCIQCIDVIVK